MNLLIRLIIVYRLTIVVVDAHNHYDVAHQLLETIKFNELQCEQMQLSAAGKIKSLKNDYASTFFNREILPEWHQFLSSSLMEPFCHLKSHEWSFSTLLPIYSLLIGEFGSLACSTCDKIISGTRLKLTRHLYEINDDISIHQSIIDDLLPTNACDYLLPMCAERRDVFVINHLSQIVDEQKLGIIGALKLNWSLLIGPNDAAGDPAYFIDPDSTYNMPRCFECTVCISVFDHLVYTKFADPAWIKHAKEAQIICDKYFKNSTLYGLCNKVIDQLIDDLQFDLQGQSICPMVKICDSTDVASAPGVYQESDLLRCLQNLCQWLCNKIGLLNNFYQLCAYFPKSHNAPGNVM